MNTLNLFFILLAVHVSQYTICKKFKILLDNPNKEHHKRSSSLKVPLTGGIFLITSLIISTFFSNYDMDIFFLFSLIFIFFLGYFSDTINNFKPKYRLLLQILVIIFFLISNNIEINKTGLIIIDSLLDNKIFNYFFTTCCILVFLNGCNFCDGVNCNILGYFLIITLILIYRENYQIIFLKIILIILSILFIFNFFNLIYLGDNGNYVISIIFSLIIISYINDNLSKLSPILAINILWYPAFENLFTIIRRFSFNENIETADKKHLHNLILNFYLSVTKGRAIISNSLSGLSLNLFNLLIIFLSFVHKANTQILILILILNIIIYTLIYLKLFKIFSKN